MRRRPNLRALKLGMSTRRFSKLVSEAMTRSALRANGLGALLLWQSVQMFSWATESESIGQLLLVAMQLRQKEFSQTRQYATFVIGPFNAVAQPKHGIESSDEDMSLEQTRHDRTGLLSYR